MQLKAKEEVELCPGECNPINRGPGVREGPRQAIRDSIVISKGLVAGMRASRVHVGMLREYPEFPR